LTGKNTQLSSNSNVTVSGSQVNGEESVNISAANDVNVVASKGSNTVTESGRVTDLGVSATAYEKNNVAGVGVSVGITSTKRIHLMYPTSTPAATPPSLQTAILIKKVQ